MANVDLVSFIMYNNFKDNQARSVRVGNVRGCSVNTDLGNRSDMDRVTGRRDA